MSVAPPRPKGPPLNAMRAFEAAAPIDRTRLAGRGFVDGVLASGEQADGATDWAHARGLLNGRLERIEDPRLKAARLSSRTQMSRRAETSSKMVTATRSPSGEKRGVR